MLNVKKTGDEELRFLSQMAQATERRQFLKWSGVTIAVAIAGCSSDSGPTAPLAPDGPDSQAANPDAIQLGEGDILVLNFAYALEQLEAAFYTQVIATPYSGISADERELLDDIRAHEVIHRDFLRTALAGNAIPALEVDFSSVDFTNRASVLGTAKVFEDLGVSAYNGAGKFLVNPDFLLTAGKIVSVEARHAAAIRGVLDDDPTSFAGDDVVDENGLDVARTPAAVFALADPFIESNIDGSTLPTT